MITLCVVRSNAVTVSELYNYALGIRLLRHTKQTANRRYYVTLISWHFVFDFEVFMSVFLLYHCSYINLCSKFVQFCSVQCAVFNLLCYFGAKYHNNHQKLNLFLRKSIKLLQPELLLLAQICTKSFVGWASPQTPLGELTALPRPPNWIKGAYF